VDAQVTTATTGNCRFNYQKYSPFSSKNFGNDLTVNGRTDLSWLSVNELLADGKCIFSGSIFFDVRGDARFFWSPL
jgi:hypothetical protein